MQHNTTPCNPMQCNTTHDTIVRPRARAPRSRRAQCAAPRPTPGQPGRRTRSTRRTRCPRPRRPRLRAAARVPCKPSPLPAHCPPTHPPPTHPPPRAHTPLSPPPPNRALYFSHIADSTPFVHSPLPSSVSPYTYRICIRVLAGAHAQATPPMAPAHSTNAYARTRERISPVRAVPPTAPARAGARARPSPVAPAPRPAPPPAPPAGASCPTPRGPPARRRGATPPPPPQRARVPRSRRWG